MRLVVIKQATDLKGLGSLLLRRDVAPDQGRALLADLRELNPHVDFQRLRPGSVLLVPDSENLEADAATSIGGGALDSLSADVRAGFAAATERVKAAGARSADDRAAVNAALKPAAARRLIDGDPLLRAQFDSAEAQFAAERQRSVEALATLEETHKRALEELAALRRLLE